MTFLEACEYMGRDPRPLTGGRSMDRPAWEPRTCNSPGDIWQRQARRLVEEAVYHLWSPSGRAVVGFLSQEKGLNPDTIKAFSLGWLPADRWDAAPAWGLPEVLKDGGKPKKLWFPKGVSIPLFQGGQVVRVRIRRPEGEPRYFMLRGSSTKAMLLGDRGPVAVVVESELDALLLHQEAGDLVSVACLGNSSTRPDQAAADLLQQSRLILMALDADQAGAKESWQWWREHYPQARRWPPVAGKDPGDMLAAGVNLRAWVEVGLMEYNDVTAQPEHSLPLAGAEDEPVLEEHHEPAPPPPPATCESCPWCQENPWTHCPEFTSWCSWHLDHLKADSQQCSGWQNGEIPMGLVRTPIRKEWVFSK